MVVSILAWYIAFEIGSGSHLKTAGRTLEGMLHADLQDPDEQAVFLEHENKASVPLRELGASIEGALQGTPPRPQRGRTDAELRTKIEEVLDTAHY